MFYLRLAHDLGYANVDAMLAEMTSVQVVEWQAYYRHEHLGESSEYRADLRMAFMTSVIANHLRTRKPLKYEDLMPRFERPRQSAEALHAGMMALAARPQPPPRQPVETNAKAAQTDGDPEAPNRNPDGVVENRTRQGAQRRPSGSPRHRPAGN